MRCFDINGDQVSEGITVDMNPYPRIVIGEGGHKRATWIPLGKRDIAQIVQTQDVMGERWDSEKGGHVKVKTGEKSQVNDVGIIALKDDPSKPSGRYLVVAPSRDNGDKVLVVWRVASGYRGGASITAGEGVTVIGSDSSWHSGRGNMGETAEILAVMRPGQTLTASRSGRRVQENRGRLTYLGGGKFQVEFGDDNMFVAETAEPESAGEYI